MAVEIHEEVPDMVTNSPPEVGASRAAGRRTTLEGVLGVLAIIAILVICLGYGLLILSLLEIARSLGSAKVHVAAALEPSIRVLLPSLAATMLIYFALYNAHRRRLSRIEFEGHIFETDPGAWGYAMRALGYLLLTLVSFGILLPLHTFQLQKFVTARCRLSGGIMFDQGGNWVALYPAMMHLFIGSAATALFFALSGTVFHIIGGLIWVAVGAAYYRARSIDYLTKRQHLSSLGRTLLPRAESEMRAGDFPMTNMYVARAISRAAFSLPVPSP